MFAIRCTQKLRLRGAPAAMVAPGPTTTVLGDWYANILVTRPQHLVLCISERTLLPVVIPAKDMKELPARLYLSVENILKRIGVPESLVNEELNEMATSYFAKTESRKVLGSLNDFMFHLRDGCARDITQSLEDRSMRLANIPTAAIEFAFPTEQTLSLFQAKQTIKTVQSAA